MFEDRDNEFFDELYRQWTMTSLAQTHYWMPEECVDGTKRFKIYAVNQDGEKKLLASELAEDDAEFITSMHGALPELIRRLHDAIDEAVAKDTARDEAEAVACEALLEVHGLKAEIAELEKEIG